MRPAGKKQQEGEIATRGNGFDTHKKQIVSEQKDEEELDIWVGFTPVSAAGEIIALSFRRVKRRQKNGQEGLERGKSRVEGIPILGKKRSIPKEREYTFSIFGYHKTGETRVNQTASNFR